MCADANRTKIPRDQRHSRPRPFDCSLTSHQSSARLPLDRRRSRMTGAAASWPRQPSRSSDFEFSGNVSLLCRARARGVLYESHGFPFGLGCATLFLGALRIPARRSPGLRTDSLRGFLEHGVCWNRALAHRASEIIDCASAQPKIRSWIDSGRCWATLVTTLPRRSLVSAVRWVAPITR